MADQVLTQDQATDLIRESWTRVIEFVNAILKAHDKFGFASIEAKLNPSLKDILHSLSVVDFLLDEVVRSDQLQWDEIRAALNSKQCILHMKLLAAALESGNNEQYQEAIHLLSSQSKF